MESDAAEEATLTPDRFVFLDWCGAWVSREDEEEDPLPELASSSPCAD